MRVALLVLGVVLIAHGVVMDVWWVTGLGGGLLGAWHVWLERSLGARHKRKERCHGRP